MGIIKNVAIVGHASKGKTTLSEAMLGVAGVVERMGKIADGNTRVSSLKNNADRLWHKKGSVPCGTPPKVTVGI